MQFNYSKYLTDKKYKKKIHNYLISLYKDAIKINNYGIYLFNHIECNLPRWMIEPAFKIAGLCAVNTKTQKPNPFLKIKRNIRNVVVPFIDNDGNIGQTSYNVIKFCCLFPSMLIGGKKIKLIINIRNNFITLFSKRRNAT